VKRVGAAVGLLVSGVAGLATLLVPGDAVILVMGKLYRMRRPRPIDFCGSSALPLLRVSF
jgi:hypothetical protein